MDTENPSPPLQVLHDHLQWFSSIFPAPCRSTALRGGKMSLTTISFAYEVIQGKQMATLWAMPFVIFPPATTNWGDYVAIKLIAPSRQVNLSYGEVIQAPTLRGHLIHTSLRRVWDSGTSSLSLSLYGQII
ncbi:hypothetical protein ARMGADRAFT_732130 [Armillaria gallica]|uniref:Uncharacterized protein n=1 Tax=Armillaria gallica TaxID=47427 RepID=A0A2H3CHK3_ARMGA|nr:hypothetical protein ARMGADRAFT_732130 [Armillaria gallica]